MKIKCSIILENKKIQVKNSEVEIQKKEYTEFINLIKIEYADQYQIQYLFKVSFSNLTETQ
jgi:hypothetical protein